MGVDFGLGLVLGMGLGLNFGLVVVLGLCLGVCFSLGLVSVWVWARVLA